ncbi:MAG: PKD domain-containing protein [Thermoplasmata archaeon]|nr:PKD domain-containing protein [Thermoplasmata archaeon]
MNPSVPASSPGGQWFDVVAYDYGFWITDSRTGQNDTSSWHLYEGWTVNINATSYPPDAGVGGADQHGVGILSASRGLLISMAAPVGSWNSGSFVAPFVAESGDQVYCTTYCGPGHGSMSQGIIDIGPAPGAPTATASGGPVQGHPPLTVNFTGGGSGGTPPYAYSWDFGDGASSTLQDPSHTYTSVGTYRAVLTLTDSAGEESQASVAVSVLGPPPLLASASATPSTGTAPLAVSFSSTVSGGLLPYTYAWDFGDGGQTAGAVVNHTYSVGGSYAALLTVMDATGATSRVWTSVSVSSPSPLQVTALADRTSGPAWLHVNLSANASGGTSPLRANWTFGDGSWASGIAVEHVFRSAGSFTPQVVVTDASGRSGIGNAPTILVSGGSVQPLALRVTADPFTGSVPINVTATASITGGTGGYSVAWSFGDGGLGSGVQATHRYSAPGSFVVTATATDSRGDVAGASTNVSFTGLRLQVVTNRSLGEAPMSVDAVASLAGGVAPYSPVEWWWGDASSASGCTDPACTGADHIYATPPLSGGNYTLRATVSDAHGALATAEANVSVGPALVGSLMATATSSSSSLAPPFLVNFSLRLTGGSGSYPGPFLWNFGDGTTNRTGLTAHEMYHRAGTYLAFVRVEDSEGYAVNCSTTVTVSAAPSTAPGGARWSAQAQVPWNGIGNPASTALALLGLMAMGTLLLLVRGPRRPHAGKGTSSDGSSESPSHVKSRGRNEPPPKGTDSNGRGEGSALPARAEKERPRGRAALSARKRESAARRPSPGGKG